MRNPPILISVIGFFAALAGFGQLFFGLRVLGFDWFGLFGDLPAYESVGLWGWFAIIVGVAWILVALGLWALQSWALGARPGRRGRRPVPGRDRDVPVPRLWASGFAMAIMPGLLIWYLNTSEVKQAFGEEPPPVV